MSARKVCRRRLKREPLSVKKRSVWAYTNKAASAKYSREMTEQSTAEANASGDGEMKFVRVSGKESHSGRLRSEGKAENIVELIRTT